MDKKHPALQYDSINWEQMVLFWETTDFCNAKCIMCGAHTKKRTPHNLPQRFTTLEEFEIILNNILSSPYQPGAIVYSWLGESLLNPQFPQMLKLADKAGIKNQQFNTNGIALTPEIIDKIIQIPSLKRIHLSLDAASKETFFKIKKSYKFGEVKKNIEYLLQKKREIDNNLNLVFAFIVQWENYQEAPLFKEWITQLLEKYQFPYTISYDVVHSHEKEVILFSRLLTENQTKANLLHKKVVQQLGLIKSEEKNNSFQPIIKTEQVINPQDTNRPPCASLWLMPNIDSRGNLTICCHDLDLQMKLGNLLEKTFFELWFGKKMENYRILHLEGKFGKLPLCRDCPGIEHFLMEQLFK